MLLTSTVVTCFGGWEQVPAPAMLMVLPIATWELSVGIYMAAKGFRTPHASTDDMVGQSTAPSTPAGV